MWLGISGRRVVVLCWWNAYTSHLLRSGAAAHGWSRASAYATVVHSAGAAGELPK